MEKNIYESIQEWFELQQQGIITNKEFQDKKAELLNTVKKQTKDLTNKSQSKEIEPIENSTVEFSETINNTANIESNKFFELIAKYKFYIIFIALAIIMSVSYFKNFYKADKNEVSDLNTEIEKWKKELYDNKEVGPECIEDYGKWMEDNPDYYYGLQDTKTFEADFNSDGVVDYLVTMPAINCVGGNGSASDFGLLVYSEGSNILTNKNITSNISEKLKIKLSENQIYIDHAIFNYEGFDKYIVGKYNAYLEDDAQCCASYSGNYAYNIESATLEIDYKKN